MTYYPNEVIKIDRHYIEEDLKNKNSILLDVNNNLDDQTFDAIAHELFENADKFIRSCYSKVEKNNAVFERNKGAIDSNPHYKLYLKNNIDSEFEFDGVFTNISDARYTTINVRPYGYEYKITEVKNGIEGDKNFYQFRKCEE